MFSSELVQETAILYTEILMAGDGRRHMCRQANCQILRYGIICTSLDLLTPPIEVKSKTKALLFIILGEYVYHL